jgi:hypothetical protein
MLTWKYLLMSSGFGMILAAASILAYDLYSTYLSERVSISRRVYFPDCKKSLEGFASAGIAGLGTNSGCCQHGAYAGCCWWFARELDGCCASALYLVAQCVRDGFSGLLRCLNSTEAFSVACGWRFIIWASLRI